MADAQDAPFDLYLRLAEHRHGAALEFVSALLPQLLR